MMRLSLAHDRRGTAAIEFALILPVMMLLGLGLVDTVLRNLLMIDVEMAADVGARMALHAGATPYQVADAMAGLGVAGLEPKMTVFQCGSKKKSDEKDKEKEDRKEKNDDDDNDRRKMEKSDSIPDGSDSCTALPSGRYMRIVAAARRMSLFGMARSTTITAVTQVRLP
jgi:hypothetical protein